MAVENKQYTREGAKIAPIFEKAMAEEGLTEDLSGRPIAADDLGRRAESV